MRTIWYSSGRCGAELRRKGGAPQRLLAAYAMVVRSLRPRVQTGGALLVVGALAACSQAGDGMPTPLVTSPTTGPTTALAPSGDIPCDLVPVLGEQCAGCHGAVPRLGAPMSLMKAADFQAMRAGGGTYSASAMFRLRDAARPMPPAGLLTDAALLPFDAWLSAGALPDAAGCAVVEPPPSSPSADTTAIARPAPGPGAPATDTSAGVSASNDMGTAPGGQPLSDAGVGTTVPMAGPDGWAMYGRDLANTRANHSETVLDPSTVGSLKRLWETPIPSTTSTPAVVDGVVYLPAWDGTVYALSADDGSQLWATRLPDLIDSSAAVTQNQVFVSDDAGSVHALNRGDGVLQWSTRVDPHPATHLWSSPIHIPEADLIVVGVASSEEDTFEPGRTFRGGVVALRASDGEEVWRFYATPADATSGPGIAVWGTVAVDTTRKTLYVGTGNNYEPPTGPLADSMLAINYETGKLVWSNQFTADDVFVVFGGMGPDFDIGSTANLFSIGEQDVVGIGVKDGFYYALDRDAGTIVWMTSITPGSVLGGVIAASAYDGNTVYVASNSKATLQTRTVALDAADGRIKWEHLSIGDTYGGVAYANGVVYVGTSGGSLHAIDASSGAELFVDMLPDSIAGGSVVANGMLFVPWGYRWTLSNGEPGTGGLIAYGLD